MIQTKLLLMVVLLYSIFIQIAYSNDNHIYNLNGNDKIEVILEKIGAPKNSKLPLTFNIDQKEIKITESIETDRIVTIEFTPAELFNFQENFLYEKVEMKNTSDRVNQNIILADPQSGRIWKLNTELKVTEFDLVKPWKSKNKMFTLKEILTEMNQIKIHKKKREKK